MMILHLSIIMQKNNKIIMRINFKNKLKKIFIKLNIYLHNFINPTQISFLLPC